MGALLGDAVLSFLIGEGLSDELHALADENLIKRIKGKVVPLSDRRVLLIFSCLLISSPLPTELGVALMASIRDLPRAKLVIITFILHSIGMLSILLLSSVL